MYKYKVGKISEKQECERKQTLLHTRYDSIGDRVYYGENITLGAILLLLIVVASVASLYNIIIIKTEEGKERDNSIEKVLIEEHYIDNECLYILLRNPHNLEVTLRNLTLYFYDADEGKRKLKGTFEYDQTALKISSFSTRTICINMTEIKASIGGGKFLIVLRAGPHIVADTFKETIIKTPADLLYHCPNPIGNKKVLADADNDLLVDATYSELSNALNNVEIGSLPPGTTLYLCPSDQLYNMGTAEVRQPLSIRALGKLNETKINGTLALVNLGNVDPRGKDPNIIIKGLNMTSDQSYVTNGFIIITTNGYDGDIIIQGNMLIYPGEIRSGSLPVTGFIGVSSADSAPHVIVSNNTINGTGVTSSGKLGINLRNLIEPNVAGNTVINLGSRGLGIFIYESYYASMERNIVKNVGTGIMSSASNITRIMHNHIEDAYQKGIDHSGSSGRNVFGGIITNNFINNTGTVALYIGYSNDTISGNNVITNTGYYGIQLYKSYRVSVEYNTVKHTASDVIDVGNSHNITIENNELAEHPTSKDTVRHYGIYLWGGSSFVNIESNSIYNVKGGIISYYGAAVNVTIQGNEIFNTTDYGLEIRRDSANITVYNNQIHNTSKAIFVDRAGNITIQGNTITNSSNIGIELTPIDIVKIISNNLIDNGFTTATTPDPANYVQLLVKLDHLTSSNSYVVSRLNINGNTFNFTNYDPAYGLLYVAVSDYNSITSDSLLVNITFNEWLNAADNTTLAQLIYDRSDGVNYGCLNATNTVMQYVTDSC